MFIIYLIAFFVLFPYILCLAVWTLNAAVWTIVLPLQLIGKILGVK